MPKSPSSHYPIRVRWGPEDGAFLAEVVDLAGCIADGPTEAQAITAALAATRDWLAVARQENREIPPASSPDQEDK